MVRMVNLDNFIESLYTNIAGSIGINDFPKLLTCQILYSYFSFPNLTVYTGRLRSNGR